MRKILIPVAALILLACNNEKKTDADTKMSSPAADSTAKKQQAEFADQKYVDWGKKKLGEFESGNIDAWLTAFADSARYYWSGGDSLVGKQAITNYWKRRRGEVIKSIKFSNDIWLAIKVNTPQKGPDRPGVWLMSWYQVNSTYNNGHSVQFFTHVLQHFDDNDKVDQVVQYIDFVPINKALGVK
jgi:hypothetical protein